MTASLRAVAVQVPRSRKSTKPSISHSTTSVIVLLVFYFYFWNIDFEELLSLGWLELVKATPPVHRPILFLLSIFYWKDILVVEIKIIFIFI